MKSSSLLLLGAALCSLSTAVNPLFAQGTAFTYNGRLTDGGNPANGGYDLSFSLFDAETNGNAVAGPITNSATVVSHGLFTVTLTATNTVAVSWPSPSTGFSLQQNTNLNTGNWVAPAESVADNGTNKSILVNPPSGNRFYRLSKP